MRILRFSALLVATLASAVLLPAIATAQEDDAALALGREYTAAFFSGNTEAVWEKMGDQMRAQLSNAEALAGFRTQAVAQLGEETEVVSETTTEENGSNIYVRKSKYANTGETVIETVFVTNADDVIEGVWIRPSQSTPEPPRAEEVASAASAATDAGIATSVPHAPTVFVSSEGAHLTYEVAIANERRAAVMLESVTAAGADGTMLTLDSEALRAAVVGDSLEIAAGATAFAYLWVDLASDAPTPIEHTIRLVGDATPVAAATVTPSPGAAITLAAPLRGADWLAANGPSNTSNHRRARLDVEGRRVIAQRYAIDFVQLENSATFSGDPEENSSYHCWGAEALAVVSGVVIDVKDGIPENVPGINSRAVEITMETVAGNYVILGLGEGRFAMYAHLQPGSLRVEVGDHVRVGDVLGLVGNSTEPHLHFQVSDSSSPLGGEGLPYQFSSWTYQGNGSDPSAVVPAAEGSIRQAALPLENDVVGFEGRK